MNYEIKQTKHVDNVVMTKPVMVGNDKNDVKLTKPSRRFGMGDFVFKALLVSSFALLPITSTSS